MPPSSVARTDDPEPPSEETTMADLKHYLRLDGIEGDSKDPGHKGWIDVQAFGFKTAGGGGPVEARLTSLECVCYAGTQSVFMLHHLGSGLRIPKGIVESTQVTRGKPSIFFRGRITDIVVTDVNPHRGAPPLTEYYSLLFAGVSIEVGHAPITDWQRMRGT
ncbi:MAG: type VI secretion system tube protein Hcp [Gemmataceae bacterium]